MKIVEPKYEILTDISEGGIEELQQIERVARVCYKSEDKITPDGESAKKLVRFLVKQEHEAMLEHSQLSVLFTCDRGVANELVRHRIASFAQESTRYCNYSKEKFEGSITVVEPFYIDKEQNRLFYRKWVESCELAEKTYFLMLMNGYRPEQARCVLPLCLKTEIVVTANYREWRNIFKLRTVMAIPVSDKVPIKSTRPLEQLKGFDPKTAYAVPEGNPNNVRLMKKEEKQREMGVISNLITDMTLRGASEEELARAVKHSMVVIDAEKHKLDYKRSERENGIQELKEKWQIRVDEDGTTHYGGASTLLSRRKQTIRVPERRGSVRVDKETGELIYKESGRAFIDPKTKKERIAEDTVSLISETKDARTLSSGTIQENLYADFSNKLKAMAAQARKEAVNMKGIQRDSEAAKTYAAEVMSLKDKCTTMLANKPKERKAMLIANANIKAKIQELGLDPQNTEDKKEIKKISSVEMQRARDKVGASGQKSKVRFSDREWEAIQAGAISDNMLSKFLNSSDSDEIVKRAMPKTTASLSSAKLSKARAMLRSGYTYKEIAQACGVPESTVYDALGK